MRSDVSAHRSKPNFKRGVSPTPRVLRSAACGNRNAPLHSALGRDIFSEEEKRQALILRGMRLPLSAVCRRPKMPFVGTDNSLEIS